MKIYGFQKYVPSKAKSEHKNYYVQLVTILHLKDKDLASYVR